MYFIVPGCEYFNAKALPVCNYFTFIEREKLLS